MTPALGHTMPEEKAAGEVSDHGNRGSTGAGEIEEVAAAAAGRKDEL